MKVELSIPSIEIVINNKMLGETKIKINIIKEK